MDNCDANNCNEMEHRENPYMDKHRKIMYYWNNNNCTLTSFIFGI
jgi:hypothetical protein